MEKKRLPIGIDDFETIIKEDYYYIDKTGFIKEILEDHTEADLIMRPEQFGKSLNMSMLKAFLDPTTDKSIFNGLAISKEKELCEKYMGKYPVISISFKNVTATNYEDAFQQIRNIILNEATHFKHILNEDSIPDYHKMILDEFFEEDKTSVKTIDSLYDLSWLLRDYYFEDAIILIEDYDLPFENAYRYDYYREMYDLLMSMFGCSLKGNDNLFFGILTDYLPLYNESLTSGFNNYCESSVTCGRYNTAFGFTDKEVRKLLKDYELEEHYQEIKEWYGGYQFTGEEMYNPSSVISYCNDLINQKVTEPKVYWQEDQAMRYLLDKTNSYTIRSRIKDFLSDEKITFKIDEHFSRQEADKNLDKTWSLLFMSGYLTLAGDTDWNYYPLRIPNKEIKQVLIKQIKDHFSNIIKTDPHDFTKLFEAFENKNIDTITSTINEQLIKAINYYVVDNSFYHDFLLTILNTDSNWVATIDENNDIILKKNNGQYRFDIKVNIEQDYTSFENICEKQKDDSSKTTVLGHYFFIVFHKNKCVILIKDSV